MSEPTKEQRLQGVNIFQFAMWNGALIFLGIAMLMHFTSLFGDLPKAFPLAMIAIAIFDVFFAKYMAARMRAKIEADFDEA